MSFTGDAARRLRGLEVVTTAGLFAGVVLSWSLWVPDRRFPAVPLIDVLGRLPSAVGWLALALLFAAGALVALPRTHRAGGALIAGCLVVLALLDAGRLQPWSFQDAITIGLMAAIPWRRSSSSAESTLATVRLLVPCIYLWSGVHKLNDAFYGDVGLWLLEPLSLDGAITSVLVRAAPFLEAGVGVALLVPSLWRVGVWAAVSMHAYILFALGPLGHDFNSVVWPWNVAMCGTVLVVYFRGAGTSLVGNLASPRPLAHKIILVLCAAVPALHVGGHWDTYLSWSLYSGRGASAYILVDQDALPTLPPGARERAEPVQLEGEPWFTIDVYDWGMQELNVPPYPEGWYFRRLFESMCRHSAGQMWLRVEDAGTTEELSCAL